MTLEECPHLWVQYRAAESIDTWMLGLQSCILQQGAVKK